VQHDPDTANRSRLTPRLAPLSARRPVRPVREFPGIEGDVVTGGTLQPSEPQGLVPRSLAILS
jgi:hypothetical protein